MQLNYNWVEKHTMKHYESWIGCPRAQTSIIETVWGHLNVANIKRRALNVLQACKTIPKGYLKKLQESYLRDMFSKCEQTEFLPYILYLHVFSHIFQEITQSIFHF